MLDHETLTYNIKGKALRPQTLTLGTLSGGSIRERSDGEKQSSCLPPSRYDNGGGHGRAVVVGLFACLPIERGQIDSSPSLDRPLTDSPNTPHSFPQTRHKKGSLAVFRYPLTYHFTISIISRRPRSRSPSCRSLASPSVCPSTSDRKSETPCTCGKAVPEGSYFKGLRVLTYTRR